MDTAARARAQRHLPEFQMVSVHVAYYKPKVA